MNKEVKEFCEIHKLTENQFYGREEFKGNLDLRSLTELTELPQGLNLTDGGSIDLSSLIELTEVFI